MSSFSGCNSDAFALSFDAEEYHFFLLVKGITYNEIKSSLIQILAYHTVFHLE